MKNYKIIIASTNNGKVTEIKKILESQSLQHLKIDVKSLQEYKVQEPKEIHNSFIENALLKAKYYAHLTKEATLSEDSGLCVESLNGFPGVRTKEFIVEYGGVFKALIKLKELLEDSDNYKAYFNSAIVLYIPSQNFLITHEAKDYGTITFPPRGIEGFGFDPIFIPNGYDKTYAELGTDVKNRISHRSKAMAKLAQDLQEFLKKAT